MADEITQALANRRRRAGQEYNLDQLDAEPGVLARLSRGEGLPTVASRRGLTPEEYDRREGTISVPVRPGGDTVEQRVAKGVARAPHDMIEVSGIGQAARSGYAAAQDPTRDNIGQAALDAALSVPGAAVAGRAIQAAAGPVARGIAKAAEMLPETANGRAALGAAVLGGGTVAGSAEAGDPFNAEIATKRLGEIEKRLGAISAEKRQNGQTKGLSKDRTDKLNADLDAEALRLESERSKLNAGFMAEQQRVKDTQTPFSKLYPNASMAMQAAGPVLGTALAVASKGRANRNFNAAADRIESEWKGANDAARNAIRDGNIAEAQQSHALSRSAQGEAAVLEAAGPGSSMPGTIGFLGAELGVNAPTGIDYVRTIGDKANPLYGDTRDAMSDPKQLASRAAAGYALGSVPAKLATVVMKPRPVVRFDAQTNATEGTLNGNGILDMDRIGDYYRASQHANQQAATVRANSAGAIQQLRDAERTAAEARQLEQASAQKSSQRSGQMIDGEVVRPDAGTPAGQSQSGQTQLPRQLQPLEQPGNPSLSAPVPIGTNNALPQGGNQALTEKIGELVDTLNRQAVGGDVAAAMQLRKLESQIAEAQKGNAEAMQALVSKIDQMGARGQKALPATSLDDIWAEKYSPHARAIVGEHLDKGGNIVKGTYARDGGLTRQALDDEIAARAGGKGAGKSQTGARMDVLLDELERQGFGIPTLTGDQYRAALAKIDPRRFAVPVAIGATGGAAMIGGDDAMAGIDPSDRRFALARALMQAGAR